MRIILLGNAGAGKSTLAKVLTLREPASRLSLDDVAFDGGTQRRPLKDSIADVEQFIAAHQSWIIEGCYADLIEPTLRYCEELIFLNPGIETCVAHCRSRPWEPEKFESSREQEQNLAQLIAWVRRYEERVDEYGLLRHRALFESFRGEKRELTDPRDYASTR